MSRMWLVIDEEIAYRRKINCSSIVELSNIGKYLYKIKYKRQNKVRNIPFEVEKVGEEL